MTKILKKVARFLLVFFRSFLFANGKLRNALVLIILLASSWLVADIYHFNSIREIATAVVDMDNSSVSRTVVRYLDASTMVSVSNERPHSIEEARRMIVEGKVGAVVLIPSDFSASLKKGKRAEVIVASDMSNILIGRNVNSAIAAVIGTVSAGIRIKTLEKMGESSERAAARVLPLVSEDNYSFNAAKSYATYLVPGLMLFFLYIYMTLQCLSVMRSPDRAWEKAGAYLGLIPHGVLLGLVFLYIYLPGQELTVHSGMSIVAILLAMGFAVMILFEFAIKSLFRGEIIVMQVSVFLSMLSLMFSGITWPTDMFPMPLQWFSKIIPFTPMARGMRILVHFPADNADLFQVFTMFGGQVAFYAAVILVCSAIAFPFWISKRRKKSETTILQNDSNALEEAEAKT